MSPTPRETNIATTRGESLEAVVARCIGAGTDRVTLTVPSGAAVGSSVNNFRIMRRETESAGKQLTVESVDGRIVEFASVAGLPAASPSPRSRGRAVLDIVARPRSGASPVPERGVDDGAEPVSDAKPGARRGREVSAAPRAADASADTATNAGTQGGRGAPGVPADVSVGADAKTERENEERPALSPELPASRGIRERIKTRTVIRASVAAVFVGLVGVGGWAAAARFTQASITARLVRTSSPFSLAVTVRVATVMPDATKRDVELPGQSFTVRKNLTRAFPTKNRTSEATRASGELVVVNGFGPESQVLVRTTRFVSPEGKVFRLGERAVIPGARIVGGRIVPATTTVRVAADGPGDSFNVPASTGWRIPGFAGTPKYDGFTAAAPSPLAGGFTGDRPEPTAEEFASATSALDAALRGALQSEIALLRAGRFRELDGATSFITERQTVVPSADPNAFQVYAEATMHQIVFDEQMLRDAIVSRTAGDEKDALALERLDVSYSPPSVDWERKVMVFTASGTAHFHSAVTSSSIAQAAAGMEEGALRLYLAELPGFEQATVGITPFWIGRAPTDPGRIRVTLE